MTNKEQSTFKSESIRIPTPDGTLNVFVLENDEGFPFEIQLVIGKSGSSLAAWAESTAKLASLLLQTNAAKINDLTNILISNNGDKIRLTNSGEIVRSGPDGLALALMKYQNGKFDAIREQLGIGELKLENDDG